MYIVVMGDCVMLNVLKDAIQKLPNGKRKA